MTYTHIGERELKSKVWAETNYGVWIGSKQLISIMRQSSWAGSILKLGLRLD